MFGSNIKLPPIERKRRMPPHKPNNGITVHLGLKAPFSVPVKTRRAIRSAIDAGACFYSHENTYGFFLQAKIPGLARMQPVFTSAHFSHFSEVISCIGQTRGEIYTEERMAA
jgi:hypothetical protein